MRATILTLLYVINGIFKLKKQHPKNKGYCFLVKQSQELLNLSDWDVKVEHCYRESNQAADLLANLGFCLLYTSPSPRD